MDWATRQACAILLAVLPARGAGPVLVNATTQAFELRPDSLLWPGGALDLELAPASGPPRPVRMDSRSPGTSAIRLQPGDQLRFPPLGEGMSLLAWFEIHDASAGSDSEVGYLCFRDGGGFRRGAGGHLSGAFYGGCGAPAYRLAEIQPMRVAIELPPWKPPASGEKSCAIS